MSLRTKLKHLTGTLPATFRRLHHLPSPPQQLPENPQSHLKEDPIQVLSDIWVKSFSEPQKPFQYLTGFLSKLDLWVIAYQRACAHFTGSYPHKYSIPSHTISDLLSLKNAVVSNKFKWNSKLEQLIRSPKDKVSVNLLSKTKIKSILASGPQPFQDRVVQEVLLMILEPVYEARFSAKSHGFRPGRNPHTVIRTIRSNFAGYLWFIRGDLSEITDCVGENVVLKCFAKVVKDRKVLSLVKSGLRGDDRRNGRVVDNESKPLGRRKIKKSRTKKKILSDDEPKPDPYWLRTFFDFAPEEAARVPDYGYCGILSPLLMNICLNELDFMMESKIEEFFRPCASDSIWRHSINDGCHNPSWPEFVPSSGKEKTRKMDYIRFAGHFLVGIRGAREEAVQIRKDIIEFCEQNFGIRLDNSKVEIEHITRGIQFLDHIICRRVIYPTLRYTSSGGNIVNEKGAGTMLSVTASFTQCISQFRRLALVKGDRDPEPLPCTAMLYSGQAHTNSQMNKLLETMADWYRYADNRKKVVGFCAYVIRSSLAKLYAARYRLKSRAKVYKIASRNLSRPLIDSTKNAAPEYSDLLRMGLVDAIEGVQFSHMSLIPSCDYTPFPRNWIPEHERLLREYMRLQDPKLFCELNKAVKKHGLAGPQDVLCNIVWDYKILGIQRYQFNSNKETINAT